MHQGHSSPIIRNGWMLSPSFSPDSKTVAIYTFTKGYKLFNSQTGVSLKVTGHRTSIDKTNCFLISPDCSSCIAAGDDKGVMDIKSIFSGQKITRIVSTKKKAGMGCLVFFSDGSSIAYGDNDGIIRYLCIEKSTFDSPNSHEISVTSVTFTPDWVWILSGSSDDLIRGWTWF